MMQLRAPVLATQRIAVRCLLTTRAHIAPLYRQSTLHAHANTAKLHQQRSLLCSAAEPQVQGETAVEAAPLPDIVKMDIRVGKILSCEKHPDADSLYIEQIDVGEEEPRTIVSGLVQYVPQEQLQDRKVIVLCNLKARNMRGVKSHGMLLCASNDAHDVVEPLVPPEGAAIGERVYFGEVTEQPEPAKENQVQKKKIWEAVQPDLKTDDGKVANYQGMAMSTSAGAVTSSTLTQANIS